MTETDAVRARFAQLPASELGRCRRRIVEVIWERGEATTDDLVAALGLSRGAIRDQTRKLVQVGLLQELASGTKKPGRPMHLFRLSKSARALVAEPATPLLDVFASVLTGDDPLRAAFATAVAAEFAHSLVPPDEDATVETNVQRLAAGLNEKSYVARADGRFAPTSVLELAYCPHAETAARFPVICEVERQALVSLVPNSEMKRVAHVLAGDGACAYRFRPRRPTS